MSSEQMLTETASQLRGFLSTDNVMGTPIDFGEKVVIPVARFGFGFGTGGGQAKDGSGVQVKALKNGLIPQILSSLI
jgi:uncharacterized spore protein YtfJ